MAHAYSVTNGPTICYADSATAASNAVCYVQKIETDAYRGIEYVTVEPHYGISDDDVYWHPPRNAPSREPVRPAIRHSPRRHIAPIHFRHVRCQQRQREHRSRGSQ